jgi:hypothetical protein
MSQGPTLIFDKSTLQSLNADEAVWLDQFFTCNITPVFFLEVLGDLEKLKGAQRRSPEKIVGNLAYKTPDLHSGPNAHHLRLLASELAGHEKTDLTSGNTVLAHGIPVALGEMTGILFKETNEELALQRWQYGKFRDVERLAASQFRAGLSRLRLDLAHEMFQPIAAAHSRPKDLAGVKARANSLIENMPPDALIRYGLNILGYSPKVMASVLSRWQAEGRPKATEFLPYFSYVLGVDLFFYIGIASDLISPDRPSNRIDMAYLYYLPFCEVFASNDRLHENSVPLFMRPDQAFVKGLDLKAELAKLDAHYSGLPDEEKAQGVYHMASDPPDDQSFLVTRLWDRYQPHWRELRDARKKPSELKMTDEIRALRDQLENAQPIAGTPPDVKPGVISISRSVRINLGKWRRMPPDVKPESDNQ